MTNLPPGRTGLPFIGETFAMLKNPYRFLAERRQRHGVVFRSRILGRNVAFLSGPEGVAAFLDSDKVTRERGHPAHVRELFGGVNINMYDGARHRALKEILLKGFDDDALESYIPALESLVTAGFARWHAAGELPVANELRALAIDMICENVFGIAAGSQSAAVRADYEALTPGFLSTPIPLPGTVYWRAKKARARLFTRFRELIADHKKTPRADALSLMLGAKASDGTTIDDEALALELNHVVVAGYIVYGLFAELLLKLHQKPALLDEVRAEVRELAPLGTPLTLATLSKLRHVGHLVLEAKRTAPILPLVFGSARRSFEHAGFTIPEGWGVFLGLSLSNRDAEVFATPGEFDPARYAAPRSEQLKHAYAWVPQGGGPKTGHRCLGVEYSTLMAQVFLVEALRGWTWTVPAQNLDYRWDQLPAELIDGLRIRLQPLQ